MKMQRALYGLARLDMIYVWIGIASPLTTMSSGDRRASASPSPLPLARSIDLVLRTVSVAELHATSPSTLDPPARAVLQCKRQARPAVKTSHRTVSRAGAEPWRFHDSGRGVMFRWRAYCRNIRRVTAKTLQSVFSGPRCKPREAIRVASD